MEVKPKRRPNVVYNHGTEPIYISMHMTADPAGYTASFDHKILLMPGDGIDLNVIKLFKGKPKKIA